MLLKNPGFHPGYNKISDMGDTKTEKGSNTLMEFGILRLGPHEKVSFEGPVETAVLLITGDLTCTWGGNTRHLNRGSPFDEPPTALLLPSGTAFDLQTDRMNAELAIVKTKNEATFQPRFFSPTDCLIEQFGKGTLRETSTREVRTIFDKNNMPESNLVLGEVINFPGKWSSYPPHGHNQPEIYHYRFLPAQGFGFAMDGEDKAHIVRDGDTLCVLEGVPHSQTSAPGYAMYYIWAIRHLEGDPYGPVEPRKFIADHKWVMDPHNDGKIWPYPHTGGNE